MHIAIVSGSHRNNSESERVARYIASRLNGIGATTSVITLAGNPLPLWDEGTWSGDEKWKSAWGPVSAQLSKAEALVVVSPEWGGMVPSGLKNFFLLCQGGELAHKPGMIVGVSSGIGGSYPVAELRMSGYKNNRICFIPDHVIIRTVGGMLHGDDAANDHDKGIRERIDYSLRVLVEYGKALAHVRESGVIDTKTFPFGM